MERELWVQYRQMPHYINATYLYGVVIGVGKDIFVPIGRDDTASVV